MKLITLLTDFGETSAYQAQMKGVIYSLCPQVSCIDITHSISAHNIREGAFLLRSAIPYFPRGTVHVGVVDPGVGSERKSIVLATRRHVFVGPDNGLLLPAARLFGDIAAYKITNQALLNHPVSNTFHGRDIFAPVAAHILNGLPFNQIGPRLDVNELVDIPFQKPSVLDDFIIGSVLFIDHFGNIITNISSMQIERFTQPSETLLVQIKDQQLSIPFHKSYDRVNKNELVALVGSSGFLEISMNQGNAAATLNVSSDDMIQLKSTQRPKQLSDNL